MTDDDLDAWVLASVALGERPATIAQIVSTGDLNHAVLSHAEIARGLARLAARKLVKRERDRVGQKEFVIAVSFAGSFIGTCRCKCPSSTASCRCRDR